MSTINNTDLLLVERNNVQYKVAASNAMSTLLDTDLLIVERLDIGQNGAVPGGNALTITNSSTLTTTLRADGSATFSGALEAASIDGGSY